MWYEMASGGTIQEQIDQRRVDRSLRTEGANGDSADEKSDGGEFDPNAGPAVTAAAASRPMVNSMLEAFDDDDDF
jgi:hypothetical protein